MQPSKPGSKRGVLRWQSKGLSHRGKARKHNEDAFLDQPAHGVWAVADGMGGHAAGDVASQRVIELLTALPATSDLDEQVDLCHNLLQQANLELYLQGQQSPGGMMGSTAVVMLTCAHQGAIIWAGDSRAYRLRDNALTQLTQDHSRVTDLVNQGVIAAEDADSHPDSNIITRAVGVAETLQLDVQWLDIQANDVYLLCSDGLYQYLAPPELGKIMGAIVGPEDAEGTQSTEAEADAEPSCTTVAQRLLAGALTSPARDNITALVSQPKASDTTLTTEVNPLVAGPQRTDAELDTEADDDPTQELARLLHRKSQNNQSISRVMPQDGQ